MKSINQEMLCFSTIGVIVLLIISNMMAPSDQAPLTKTRIVLQNRIPNQSALIHCWSSENDLGSHKLGPSAIFSWHFKVNIWGSTKFVCDFTTSYYSLMRSTVFNNNISGICHEYCLWAITKDHGPCLVGHARGLLCYY
ncbi:hypothetical protein CASFOL_006736 [Castilleja foliolosa]|uniref:S-protein homolog n=1 Tax=Castilleja foliolosa TaxID=1961234 RepID=A0ABD3E788_9LAMI